MEQYFGFFNCFATNEVAIAKEALMAKKLSDFPGLTIIGGQEGVVKNDAGTHYVASCQVGEIIVEMIRSVRAPHGAPNGGFVPARVVDENDKELWSFRKMGFPGMAYLAMAEAFDLPVICLVERGRGGKLLHVIPLEDLPARIVEVGGSNTILSNRSSLQLAQIKSQCARFLGIEPELSSVEEMLMERLIRKSDEGASLKAKAKGERVRAIMARDEIFGWTEDGIRRRGVPVTDDEWKCLPDGYVILVESFDEETGQPGEVVEAFRVDKRGRAPRKGNPCPVAAENPQKDSGAENKTAFAPSGTVFVVNDEGDTLEVLLFDDKDAIKSAHQNGLNSGTLATTPTNREDGQYEVRKLTTREIKMVGLMSPDEEIMAVAEADKA